MLVSESAGGTRDYQPVNKNGGKSKQKAKKKKKKKL